MTVDRFEHFLPPVVVGGEPQVLALRRTAAATSGSAVSMPACSGWIRRPANSRVTCTPQRDPASLADNDVRAVFEDSANRLWIGTASRAQPLRPAQRYLSALRPRSRRSAQPRRQFRHLASARTAVGSCGSAPRAPAPAAGTHAAGRWVIARRIGLSDGAIISAFADAPDGGLWIGTMGAGLLRLAPGQQPVPIEPSSVAARRRLAMTGVMSLLNDRAGQLWIGTMSNGLVASRRRRQHDYVSCRDWQQQHGLGADGIMSLYEDQVGRVWIGTFEGGVSVYDPQTGGFVATLDATGQAPLVRAGARGSDPRGSSRGESGSPPMVRVCCCSMRSCGLLHRFRHHLRIERQSGLRFHLCAARRCGLARCGSARSAAGSTESST